MSYTFELNNEVKDANLTANKIHIGFKGSVGRLLSVL